MEQPGRCRACRRCMLRQALSMSRGREWSRVAKILRLRVGRRSVAAGLFDACGPARKPSQIVETRAPHGSAPHGLNGLDDRRVEHEGPLDADFAGHATDGERGASPGSTPSDYHALENLRPLAVALSDRCADAYGIAGAEVLNLRVELGCDEVMSVHVTVPRVRKWSRLRLDTARVW